MNDPAITFDALIFELRAGAETDSAFARRVALLCAEFADQSLASNDETPSTKIRKVFEL